MMIRSVVVSMLPPIVKSDVERLICSGRNRRLQTSDVRAAYAAEEPQHDENDEDQADHAAEPAAAVTAMGVISTTAAK